MGRLKEVITDTSKIDNTNLLKVLNIKGTGYELEDSAARSAIDVLNGDEETEGSVLKAIVDNQSGKVLVDSDNIVTATSGKLIKTIKVNSSGKLEVTQEDITTSNVNRTATAAVTEGTKQIALSGTTTESALIELAQAISAEIDNRISGDDSLDSRLDVIEGDSSISGSIAKAESDAKAYAKNLVDTLVGEDIEAANSTWETIKSIVAELKDNTGEDGIANTILDKLVTLTAGLSYTYTAVVAGTTLTSGSTYYTLSDSTYTAVVADGTEDTSSTTYYTRADKTVKEYVDEQVAAANSSTSSAIAELDATVNSTGGSHVAVQVVEEDGKITGVTVSESNFDGEHIKMTASDTKTLAETWSDRDATISSSLTDLDSRLDILEGNDSTSGSVAKAVKDGIEALDSTVTSTNGTNVQVQVVETDGKITGVNVSTDNTVNSTDVANAISNATSNLSVSAEGDNYVNAAVDKSDNKKINVSATTKTSNAIAAAETSVQSLSVNGVSATISGNDNAKAATVTIDGTNITVGGSGDYASNSVQSAIDSLKSSIDNLDNNYATDTQLTTATAAAKTTVSTVSNSGVVITSTTDSTDGHTNYEITLNVSYDSTTNTLTLA